MASLLLLQQSDCSFDSLEKGKPSEREGRKAKGLSSTIRNMAAWLPGKTSTFPDASFCTETRCKKEGISMRSTRFYTHQVFSMVFFLSFFLFACFFSFTPFLTAADAADVTLAWDANSEDNLAGYKLYYRTNAGGAPYDGTGLAEGDSPVIIYIEDLSDAAVPIHSLTGLEEGTQYFFALTAFDSDGLESDYSDEVAHETETTAVSTYSITASATGQGTISPAGTVSVTGGGTQTFTITPGDHYHIAGVTVDGSPMGQVTSFTFENVGTTHTISAIFEIDTYTVTAAAGANGTISPAGVTSVAYGGSVGYAITPADACHVSDVIVDGSSIGIVNAYSFENISTWHTIEAVFDADVVEAVVEEPVVNADTTTSNDTQTDNTTDTANETADAGQTTPVAPVALTGTLEMDVLASVELTVGAFTGADSGGDHQETEWRVTRSDDDLCVLNTISSTCLTAITVPAIMLDENTEYYWQARFVDSNGIESGWSRAAYFATGDSQTDTDGNGINDAQEVDGSVDLNQDGLPDAEQAIVRSIVLPGTGQPIGLDIEASETVMAVLYMEAVDAESLFENVKTKKTLTSLINFKLEVAEPGDIAVVTVRFAETVNPKFKWMKLNPITGELIDYSAYCQLSSDRRSMTIELVDGGFGDDDGVANGIIVDPAGMELMTGTPVLEHKRK
jgi:hypothetical protein